MHAQSGQAVWHGTKELFDRERGVKFQIGCHVQRGACLASYRGPSQYHALWAWFFIIAAVSYLASPASAAPQMR